VVACPPSDAWACSGSLRHLFCLPARRSWCALRPWCTGPPARRRLPYTAIELNEMEDGRELQMALLGFTGQRTVPNVFINGKHLGGNDDTQRAAMSGKLQEMLQAK